MSVPVLKTAKIIGRPSRSFKKGKHVCTLLLQALMVIPGFSQTIGNWAFTSSTAGTGGTYNTVSIADFSAAIPTRAFNGGGEYFGENGWPAGGLNTSAYLQFTITPNSGYQLDLTRVIIRVRRSNTGTPAGAGPVMWALRSSLDGYAADITSNSMTHNYANYTVNLGSAFLNRYTAVTFRFYGYSSAAPSDGIQRVVFDNLSIEGIGSVLPVNITGIQAVRTNEAAIAVKWQMNNVEEGTQFNVQRSTNGIDYTTLNSFAEHEYKANSSFSYLDNMVPAVAAKLYYRIQGTTPAGRTIYSPVVTMSNKKETQLLIDYTTLQGQSLLAAVQVPENGNYTVALIGMNGAVLQQRAVELNAGAHVITVPMQSLSHGTYVVRVAGSKYVASRKFIY